MGSEPTHQAVTGALVLKSNPAKKGAFREPPFSYQRLSGLCLYRVRPGEKRLRQNRLGHKMVIRNTQRISPAPRGCHLWRNAGVGGHGQTYESSCNNQDRCSGGCKQAQKSDQDRRVDQEVTRPQLMAFNVNGSGAKESIAKRGWKILCLLQ